MTLLRERSGPLTRELSRVPGRFGLGQVPKRIAPDATTSFPAYLDVDYVRVWQHA